MYIQSAHEHSLLRTSGHFPASGKTNPLITRKPRWEPVVNQVTLFLNLKMNRALIFSHEELKTTTLLITKTYCPFRRAVQNVLNLLEVFMSDSKGPVTEIFVFWYNIKAFKWHMNFFLNIHDNWSCSYLVDGEGRPKCFTVFTHKTATRGYFTL